MTKKNQRDRAKKLRINLLSSTFEDYGGQDGDSDESVSVVADE